MTQVLYSGSVPQEEYALHTSRYELRRNVVLKSDSEGTTILCMQVRVNPDEVMIPVVKITHAGILNNASTYYNIEEARQVIAEHDKWLAELQQATK